MRRSITVRTAALALAALTTAVLSGCTADAGPSEDDSTGTIGFISLNQTQEIFISQADAAQTWADDNGFELLIGDADNDPLTQANIVDGWVEAQQVDAIIVAPIDIEALKPSLTKAAEAKIPVVVNGGLDEPFADLEAVIVTDWVEYGEHAGEALADCINEKFDGKGVVAILGGPQLPGDIVTGRINGELDKIAELAPDATVVEQQDGEGQRLPSLDLMSALLLKDPTINAVTGTNDDSMIGVVNAFIAAGKDPAEFCIVGLDATEEGLAMVDSGQFYATVDLQPIKRVTDGLEVLAEMIQGETPTLAPDYIMVVETSIVTGK